MGCRISRTEMWKRRVLNELEYWQKNEPMNFIFATLTYNDESLPENGSLRREDVKNYCKRLRWYMRKFHDKEIKYLAVGEYGEEEDRPHYHLIVLGMTAKKIVKRRLSGKLYYEDNPNIKIINDVWNNGVQRGITHVGTDYRDQEASIGYCAGYIQKKLLGKNDAKAYKDSGREPPFLNVSKGMGKRWILDNKDDIIRDGGIFTYKKDKLTGKMERIVRNIPKGQYRVLEQNLKPKEFETLKANIKARGEKHEEKMLLEMRKRGIPALEGDWILEYPLKMLDSIEAYWKKYGETPNVKKVKELSNLQREANKKAWDEKFGKKPRELRLIDEVITQNQQNGQQKDEINWNNMTFSQP
jgi:hypothetical protein